MLDALDAYLWSIEKVFMFCSCQFLWSSEFMKLSKLSWKLSFESWLPPTYLPLSSNTCRRCVIMGQNSTGNTMASFAFKNAFCFQVIFMWWILLALVVCLCLFFYTSAVAYFSINKKKSKFIFNSCLLGFNYLCLKTLSYVYALSTICFMHLFCLNVFMKEIH